MSKKKVTAPLSYNPGKGRPKEHLAYLNWEEMQALKRLNGNNQEKGPMGLPSFPPGTKSTSKSTTKSTGSGSIGSKGGGASTQKAGSGTGSKAAGKVGSSVGSRQGGGGSGSIGSKGGGASTQKAGAGKGLSKAGEVSKSRNEAQKGNLAANRSVASRSTGIKSLNVGPMGTKVDVTKKAPGSQIKGAVKSVQESAAKVQPSRVIARNPYDVTIEKQKYYSGLQQPSRVMARNPYDVTIERQKYMAPPQSKVIARNPYDVTVERQKFQDVYKRPVMARNPYDVTLERQAAKVPKIGPDKLRAYTGDVPLGSFTPPQREVDLTQDAYNRASQMGNIMRYGSPVDVRKETLGRINDARAQLASTAPKYPGADGVTEQDIGGVFDVAPEPKAASRAKTKENLLPYQERTYDTPYPTDESGVPIQDVSPEDISKIRTRRRGEEYAPTPKERTAITVGDLITKAITRNIPGSGKFFNVKENMTDYYGRPSWEQQYISDRASDYGKDVGASRSGGGNGGIMDLFPSQNTGTAPTTPTTGTPSSTTPKERPREHYYWDLGLNIPTPTDKNYTDYQNYLRQRAAARAAMYGTT